MQAVHAWPALPDEVASTVIGERDMQGLVDVTDPVSEELKRCELGLIVIRGPQDLQIRGDTCEETLWGGGTGRGGDRVHRASHVDEMFLGPLAGMIGPRTGIREGVERGVEGDQSGDLVAGLVVQLLEGDLTDDLVAHIAPRPGGRGWRDEGYGKREVGEMPEQVRVVAQGADLLM